MDIRSDFDNFILFLPLYISYPGFVQEHCDKTASEHCDSEAQVSVCNAAAEPGQDKLR